MSTNAIICIVIFVITLAGFATAGKRYSLTMVSLASMLAMPTGRAGGGYPAVPCQFRHPGGVGQPVYMEIRHSAGGDRTERAVLSSLLQVAVPVGCILCAIQPGIPVSDESG